MCVCIKCKLCYGVSVFEILTVGDSRRYNSYVYILIPLHRYSVWMLSLSLGHANLNLIAVSHSDLIKLGD